jgi:hypothetical protein
MSTNAEIVTHHIDSLLNGNADEIMGDFGGEGNSDSAGSQLLYDSLGASDRTLKLCDGPGISCFTEPERDIVLCGLTSWLTTHPRPGNH